MRASSLAVDLLLAVWVALVAVTFEAVAVGRLPVDLARTTPSSTTVADVHPTTEADLALLRTARPTLDGPVLGGLRMRWCVAQGRCERGDR